MRKKTTLALVLMMNLACAMAQKSGTTGPLSWNYNETSKELAHPIYLGESFLIL